MEKEKIVGFSGGHYRHFLRGSFFSNEEVKNLNKISYFMLREG
jgi:hypothetical protein